jgi:hypothetical protein
MYVPRDTEELTPIAQQLAEQGILAVRDLYSVRDLARLNAAMNPIFARKTSEERSYVRPDEMLAAGILDLVLSRGMKDLITAIMPDPVLYHLHAIETAGNRAKSHVFGDHLDGWHRDSDSAFFPGDPTHFSIFVHLSDVGEGDGAFEFSPKIPDRQLPAGSPAISMTGPIGTSYVWHRSFYHRASPNRGPRRRRVIKLSLQANAFHSAHLKNDFFKNVMKDVPTGDHEIDVLLGRYQGRDAPRLTPRQMPRFSYIPPNSQIVFSKGHFSKTPKTMLAMAGRMVLYD